MNEIDVFNKEINNIVNMTSDEEKIMELIKKGRSDLDREEMHLLDQLIEKYPYFQAVSTINAIQFKRNNNLGFEEALKNSAIKAPDRKFLYKLINQKTNNISDTVHKQIFKPLTDSISKDKEEKKIDTGAEKTKQDKTKIETKEKFSGESYKNKTHSFEEWLKLFSNKTQVSSVNIDIKSDTSKLKQKESSDIIDRFIKHKPMIKRAKAEIYSVENMAQKSVMEDEHLVSETLARINARQGNYNKAIRMYEKLSLLYPDKFDYFAEKINALKNELNK